MQQLIEYLDPINAAIKNKAIELLEVENEQIAEAYLQGSFDDGPNQDNAKQYYNKTYQNK